MSISHLFYLSQTLTELYLQKNQIGAEGGQVVGYALEINKVR